MSYFQLGALFKGISTTATAGGTTTLVASSKQLQQFTGTTTQIVVLPNATTLAMPRRFDILNRSTGDVTVNANGGALVAVVPAGSQRFFLLTDNSTSAGVWRTGGVTGGSSASVTSADKLNLLSGMGGTNASTDNIEARQLKLLPEEMGGNFWTLKAYVTLQKTWAAVFNLNGFVYNVGGCAGGVDVATSERYSDDLDFWYSRGNLTTARDSSSAFVLSGLAYTTAGLTGGSSTVSAVHESYNDQTNIWTAKTSYPVALYGPACFALDNIGYVAGGLVVPGVIHQSVSCAYDVATNSWAQRHSLSTASSRLSGSDSAYNGRGYVFGGTNTTGRVERYDRYTNAWTTVNAMSMGHAYAALMIMNGTATMAGGENNAGTPVQTSEQYIDSVDYWKTVASHTNTAVMTNGCSINGRGLRVAGGVGSSTHTPFVESYANSAFVNSGLLKKIFNTAPTSVLASVLANSMDNILGCQIRTDGDNWKAMLSGSDTFLKLGESYSTKLLEYPLGYNAGGGTGTATADNERYNDVQNVHDTRTALTSARRGPYYFTIAGIGYIAGGQDSGATLQTNTYSYSDILNAWVTKAGNMPVAKEEGASFTILGLGYAVAGTPAGGTFTNTVYQYNATNDAYTTKTACPISRRSPASFTLQDWGYVAGGVAGATGSPTYTGTAGHKYNPLTDTWTALGNLATGVGDNSGGFAINNYGYSVAGFNGTSEQTTVQKYSPLDNVWTSAGNLNTARSKATCYRIGSMGYASGGAIISSHEQYNPDGQISVTKTSLNVAKVNGGAIGAGSARQYEVRIGVPGFFPGIGGFVWSVGPNLTQQYGQPHGGLIDGVSIAGGAGSVNYEYLEESRNVWLRTTDHPGSSTSTAGYMTLINQLYIVSGQVPAVSTTRYYNHTTRSWTTTGNVNIARTRMYQNGRALNGFGYIFGGQDNSSVMRPEAEQYSPSTGVWTTKASLSGTSVGEGGGGGTILGHWYRFGGFDSGSNATTNIVQAYVDTTNTYLTKSNYPTAIKGTISKEIGPDRILIGTGSTSVGVRTAAMYEYNGVADVYVAKANHVIGAIQDAVFDGKTFSGGDTGASSAATYKYADALKNATLGFALEIK